MPPLWDQTGVPGLVGFTHFHSSTISGSAFLMIPRTLLSVLPRQSPSSLILLSRSSEAFVLLSAIWIVVLYAVERSLVSRLWSSERLKPQSSLGTSESGRAGRDHDERMDDARRC